MGEAWQYKMIALCYQTASLVQDADPVADADELAAIDRVFDVTYCRENSNIHGPEMRTNMTRETGVTEGGLERLSEGIFQAGAEIPLKACCASGWAFSTTRCASRTGMSNQKIVFSSSFLLYDAEPTKADQKSSLRTAWRCSP